ncbi:MAG: hypothetical protein KDA60_21690 [Planctomycetales bacterium]|nr:hypothetical protein [Planctomycetales bacterium]
MREEQDGGWMFRWLGPLAPNGFLGQVATISAIFVVLGASAFLLWNHFHEDVITQPDYQLDASRIEVTPQPSWIRTDVKAEAIEAGGLDNLNIRQEDLTPRVAQAFLMHSWVAKVHQCTKEFPAKVTVSVEYRRPVAMVKVAEGYLPVDREGFLLPPGDFTQAEAAAYPRIFADAATQLGPVGTAWGDPRIHGAAAVVDALAKYWKSLGLYGVVATYRRAAGASSSQPEFELRTSGETKIIWGSAPGQEALGEAHYEVKVARLREFHDQNGSLDAVGPGRVIDLRRTDRLYVARLPE